MLIAEFSYLLGQTWDYVENNLTFHQIFAYRKYWNNAPHIDMLAAAWLGFKPNNEENNEKALEALAPLIGGLPNG